MWVTQSVPALVDNADWNGWVGASSNFENCWATVLAITRRRTSPTTMPLTPPSGFCHAISLPNLMARTISSGISPCANCDAAFSKKPAHAELSNHDFEIFRLSSPTDPFLHLCGPSSNCVEIYPHRAGKAPLVSSRGCLGPTVFLACWDAGSRRSTSLELNYHQVPTEMLPSVSGTRQLTQLGQEVCFCRSIFVLGLICPVVSSLNWRQSLLNESQKHLDQFYPIARIEHCHPFLQLLARDEVSSWGSGQRPSSEQ